MKANFEPKWLVVIVFFAAGIFLGAFALFAWVFNGGALLGVQKIHPGGRSHYRFISPLLAVETPEKKEFFANKSLQNNIANFIDGKKKSRSISSAAVYFRDIEPGRWIGINENAKFFAGKLFKVPIMITYFKNAESDPAILANKVVYDRKHPVVNSADNLITGQLYTVEYLIKAMIINDDDNAAEILFDNISKNSLNEIFSDLGIDFYEDKTTDDFVSIKLYGLIFRILYNATYINRDMSEKALDILSQTDSTRGIAAGLPNDIMVSHKYRINDLGRSDGLLEVHDCGIAYYPDHPYLLCIMVQGKNSADTQNVFKEIGQMIYQDMAEKYKID